MVETSYRGLEGAPLSGVPLSGLERASIRERVRRGAAARPFIAYFIIVTALAAFYYGLIATPQYVSETRFSIRSKDVEAASGFLSGILGTPTGFSDISAVSDYIRSPDMLNELQKRLDLRKQYVQLRIDPFQVMAKDAPSENFLAFYRRHILVRLDHEANTVILDAKAFDQKSAKDTADAILQLTESFVNGMSQRLRDESLSSAKAEYELALKNATAARLAVSSFRGQNADLDPSATGAYMVTSLGSLQAAAITAQSQLASLRTYSRPDAPAVKQLEAQLANINAQVAKTRAGQTTTSNKPQQVTNFETLQLDRANAERVVATAETTYSSARAAAEQREKFVVRIVSPNLPQKSTSPNRWMEFFTILIFALAGYALVGLTVAAIRDHQGI